MSRRGSRRTFLATVGAASFAGCAGGSLPGLGEGATGSAAGPESGSESSGARDSTELPVAERQLPLPYSYEDLQRRIVPGGPSKDGIPSIDDPQFVPAGDAPDALQEASIVFGVARNGGVKAYPQYILVLHEIVNDIHGEQPVSVTYCPLTGTAMGFLRGETTLGVSGKLVNNNLVMYDRATDSRWPQVIGTAISGAYQGKSLREFHIVWTTWGRWRRAHPETLVFSEDTGYARSYGSDPYGSYTPPGGYYTSSRTLFEPLRVDDRYHLKRVVIGSRSELGTVAFVKQALRQQKLVETDLGGTPILAVYDGRLDTGYVYRNPDGSAFGRDGGRVTAPDGSAYAADALPLDPHYAIDGMWFAFAGFYPDISVVE